MRLERSLSAGRRGFTLVELLTVIALIIAIAALAVPNFSAMMREQRWTSAISALQVAIMRAKAYAVNNELDCAVEFCTDTEQTTYLRIEAESAYLEHIPNLQRCLELSDTMLAIPMAWYHAFLSRRDAWGPDGYRLYSGVFDCYNKGSWGNFEPDRSQNWFGHSATVRPAYDERYSLSKSRLTWPWNPSGSGGRVVSEGERNNDTGPLINGHGYQDVNDDYDYIYQAAQWTAIIQDNLAVDDYIYLPHDIVVDLTRSTVINFDAARNTSGVDVAHHGWDGTRDLRFGKSGHLVQTQTPEVVLGRDGTEFVRLRLLRGTGRLKKLQ